MAVQPFQLPLDSLFSSLTEPASPVPAAPPRTPRFPGVSRTVIAIAATSVFFGGAGSLYMHASMGHMAMADGRMTTSNPAVADDGAPMPAAAMPAAAMPGTGADAAPPRPLGDGMPVPATAAVDPAPAAAAPMDASPMASGPKPSTTTASSRISSSEAAASTSASAAPSAASSASSPVSSTVRRVTVADGDSFSTLAARHHVSEARIASLNPGVDSSALTIGQTLRVR